MISKIFDRLYIGDFKTTKEDVEKLKVFVFNFSTTAVPIQDRHYPLLDGKGNERGKIEMIIRELSDEIYRGSRVLLMCRSGISRSPFIALLYLMKVGMSYEEALDFLRERNPRTNINIELLDTMEWWRDVSSFK